MEGYVKLHRKALDSNVFSDAFLWRLWCWCLMRANWKRGWHLGCEIEPGQFATGEMAASGELGVSGSKWRRGMQKLQEYGCIKLTATNRFTVVSVVKWGEYQGETLQGDERVTNQRRTGDEPATNDRRTGDDNRRREEREEMKEGGEGAPAPPHFSIDLQQQLDSLEMPYPSAAFREAWDLFASHALICEGTQNPPRRKLQLKHLAELRSEVKAIKWLEFSVLKGKSGNLLDPDQTFGPPKQETDEEEKARIKAEKKATRAERLRKQQERELEMQGKQNAGC